MARVGNPHFPTAVFKNARRFFCFQKPLWRQSGDSGPFPRRSLGGPGLLTFALVGDCVLCCLDHTSVFTKWGAAEETVASKGVERTMHVRVPSS
ncbi:unnamed protein product [Ixodes persulcatus]